MDVHDKLDKLTAEIEAARSLPMSASCVVNRAAMLALLDDVRELLPEELHHAELLLQDREAVVDEGRREAARIIAEAHGERERLVSRTELVDSATTQAEAILHASQEEAAARKHEVDDYIDQKLATFEVVLNKTLAAVHRGRDKLAGTAELGGVHGDPGDDLPMPH